MRKHVRRAVADKSDARILHVVIVSPHKSYKQRKG
jgi:hypothetical protein